MSRTVQQRIVIGCSRAGSLGNPVPVSEIRQMWQMAIDAGIVSFDTANIYAQGDSERHLGRLIRANPGRRIEVITKAGFEHGRKATLVRLAKPMLRPLLQLKSAKETVRQVRSGIDRQDFSHEALRRGVEGSLRRLGVSSLPGFLLHDPSLEQFRDGALGAFLEALKRSGKAQRVGVSLRDETPLGAVTEAAAVEIVQLPITAWERVRMTELADRLRERGIRVQVRQILNRPDGKQAPIEEVLPRLLADDKLDQIVIGVSRIRNLEAILEALR
jgi:Predicted oxidoreductases (related to aryl-alcohol dehydrogenases)